MLERVTHLSRHAGDRAKDVVALAGDSGRSAAGKALKRKLHAHPRDRAI